MKEKIKSFLSRRRHLIMYVIIGCATTLVNFAIFYFPGMDGVHWAIRNTAAWTGAVIFAYFANRKYVYESSAVGARQKFGEFVGFVASRLFSLLAESAIFAVCTALGIGENVVKIPASVVVTVLNYVTGRLVFGGSLSKWVKGILGKR